MPFEIIRNDIAAMQVDAVVNSANPKPVVGTGVDAGIHKKAGPELLVAREKIGTIAFGDAVITPAFDLDAKYVIHTVGPIWIDGEHREEETLASCYKNSLALAKKHGCESVAFPLISTGNYGFPKALALQVAMREIGAFVLRNDMLIFLVVFEKESFVLSERLLRSVSSYVDEAYIRSKIHDEYGTDEIYSLRLDEKKASERLRCGEVSPSKKMLLRNLDAGFSETLLELIKCVGKKNSEIYNRANVDRRLFSKIRSNPDHRPFKSTAVALAMALELDLDETKDFIGRAGFAFSSGNEFDRIVCGFISDRNYNIFELNEALFDRDLPLVGGRYNEKI